MRVVEGATVEAVPAVLAPIIHPRPKHPLTCLHALALVLRALSVHESASFHIQVLTPPVKRSSDLSDR